MNVKVYVEGGGDHNKALQTECRRGFSEFLKKAGLVGRMPRIIASGGRHQTYESFRTAHEGAATFDLPILLVDSEVPISAATPWEHVRQREGDGWERPHGASDDQIHFMVQAMEAWFYADKDTLQEYYGQGFRGASLSQRTDIEAIPKSDLFAGLQKATRDCGKGEYSKGDHSFKILEHINPSKVRASSPYAKRFLDVLDRVCIR